MIAASNIAFAPAILSYNRYALSTLSYLAQVYILDKSFYKERGLLLLEFSRSLEKTRFFFSSPWPSLGLGKFELTQASGPSVYLS